VTVDQLIVFVLKASMYLTSWSFSFHLTRPLCMYWYVWWRAHCMMRSPQFTTS